MTVGHYAQWINQGTHKFVAHPVWPRVSISGESVLLKKQGLRDHAAIAVLLGSGLRVSELLGLKREQYTGRGFQNVLIKGGRIREFVPVQSHARQVLEEWLNADAARNGFIFTTRTGKPVTQLTDAGTRFSASLPRKNQV